MTEFPQYRKYVGVDTWFKIRSEKAFIEIRKLGNHFLQTEVTAAQFPEMNLIRDMLDCKDGRWEIVSAEEFDKGTR